MVFIYRIGIWAYNLLIRFSSLFNQKAKKWIKGRENWRSNYPAFSEEDKVIWMHCASLGEFEQGKPVLEELKRHRPESKVVVTFFSPSGYEVRKDYDADAVLYLPMDSPSNAKDFINKINPSLALFVKYDLWWHYLSELEKRKVPMYLISAHFRDDHRYFNWHGAIFRRMLKKLDHIYVQDPRSMSLLDKIDCSACTVAGDTRFDRVKATVDAAEELDIIERFKNGEKLVVGGSTWPPEEKIMAEAFKAELETKWIIAPHDISYTHIQQIQAKFGAKAVLYSTLKKEQQEYSEYDVLIIDNIGLLSRLYRYADLAVIGGGFTGALHNILEAAAFGVPVLFGPKHERFPEAQALIDANGAATINVQRGVLTLREFIENDAERKRFGNSARKFVTDRTGATETVVNGIIKDQN